MAEVTIDARLEVRERPSGTSVMHQDWRDLLFLHWKYDAAEIQQTLPPGLFVDKFNEDAYITISPFFIKNLSVVGMFSMPGFSSFTEINVRTYVYDKNGTPGIWFYSLDIDSLMASKAASNSFSLPYYYAEMEQTTSNTEIIIRGKRAEDPPLAINFAYRPAETQKTFASEDSLDFFLIERYVFFSFSANQLSMGQVHHEPYPLKEVKVLEWNNDLIKPVFSKDFNRQPDLIHYSPGVDVDIFPLRKVR